MVLHQKCLRLKIVNVKKITRDVVGPTPIVLTPPPSPVFYAYVSRAGEMISEVEGTRPWGSSRKRVPKCLKGPKTTNATIAIAEKLFKRSKRGPFSLYV